MNITKKIDTIADLFGVNSNKAELIIGIITVLRGFCAMGNGSVDSFGAGGFLIMLGFAFIIRICNNEFIND